MKNEPSGISGELYEKFVRLDNDSELPKNLNAICDRLASKIRKTVSDFEDPYHTPSYPTQKLTCEIPIRTVSEANSSEHWSKKNKRHSDQKSVVRIFLNHHCEKVKLPCHITLTRIAPRCLDSADNLPSSFKWIFDAICEFLIPGLKPGRADADERITVEYKQEKGKPKQYGIRITFEFA